MVNVGTGNRAVQSEDLNVPHKGLALAFRRTYNSQSGHDVNGSDGGFPGLYGNGWTNTFDAHMTKWSNGTVSVFDIDGARYDYSAPATAGTPWNPITAGQHAILSFDGQCGFSWVKKSGTIYRFYPSERRPSALRLVADRRPRPPAADHRPKSEYDADARLFVGERQRGRGRSRQRNNRHHGVRAHCEPYLRHADPNGHRLLQSLTGPGGYQVSYAYGG